VITAESAERTKLVQARVSREAQAVTMPRSEFLASLKIEQSFTQVRDAKATEFDRGFELLNKTNQFNTTGRRWTHAEMVEFFANDGFMLLTSLRDKTANNGVIGAALVQRGEIVQTVLSCRVFGLGAEIALGRVATRVALSQSPAARGRIVDTGKNFTCHRYFTELGFDVNAGEFTTHTVGAMPEWISVDLQAIDALVTNSSPVEQAAAA
jgi:FkbH-like protein